MTKAKTYLRNFLRHLAEKNYAAAKRDLSNVIEEKIKERVASVKAQSKNKSKPAQKGKVTSVAKNKISSTKEKK
jgi:hypothetical protein